MKIKILRQFSCWWQSLTEFQLGSDLGFIRCLNYSCTRTRYIMKLIEKLVFECRWAQYVTQIFIPIRKFVFKTDDKTALKSNIHLT